MHGKPPRNRKDRNRNGQPARRKASRQNARREREPWLLVAAPELADLSARQLVAMCANRMQIESSFRDLKSHRYGQGFEDSLTRKGPRISVLLLIHALATFASWLAGLACEASGLDERLNPYCTTPRLYSIKLSTIRRRAGRTPAKSKASAKARLLKGDGRKKFLLRDRSSLFAALFAAHRPWATALGSGMARPCFPARGRHWQQWRLAPDVAWLPLNQAHKRVTLVGPKGKEAPVNRRQLPNARRRGERAWAL